MHRSQERPLTTAAQHGLPVEPAEQVREGRHQGLSQRDRLVGVATERLALVTDRIGESRIAFTPRLVRGLDYYTGIIWEVVAPGMPGSIASGGRCDRLVESLGGPDVPACGGSLGVERILALVDRSDQVANVLDIAIRHRRAHAGAAAHRERSS